MKIQKTLTFLEIDSLDKYLRDIKNDPDTKTLTKDEEYLLFEEYEKTKSKSIKLRIIKSNLRWVISVAKQYNIKKAQVSDLINEGNIGLIDAFDRFDYKLGNKFFSYATSYIRKNIREYLSNVVSDIILPSNRNVVTKLIDTAKSNLQNSGNFEPTLEDLVDEYNFIKEKNNPVIDSFYLMQIMNVKDGFISSNNPMFDNISGYEETLESTFKSDKSYSPDNHIKDKESKQLVIDSLKKLLNDRELNVIVLYFGILTNESMVAEQIAPILGYTRERVGQIRDEAFRKLKKHKQLMFQILGNVNNDLVYGNI